MSDEAIRAGGRQGALTAHHPTSVSYAGPGRNRVKRVFDVVVAAALCVVLLPLLIVIAVVIKADSKGPILFIQYRRGLNGIPFRMYKFRTMYVSAQDDHGYEQAKCDDPRITSFGSFLRRSCLDELPQIWNVLRGDMSLVGPRPHAIGTHIDGRALPEVCGQYMLRYGVRPGITGWAQVNGYRGAMTKPEDLISRVDHDMFYTENATLALDIRIIAMTTNIVLRARNDNSPLHDMSLSGAAPGIPRVDHKRNATG
jgi:lipopolysaccharide/colanic/teichoic acid biosynthesis glycosyltransferase